MSNDRLDTTQTIETAQAMQSASTAWARKDFTAVRVACAQVLSAAVPAHHKSYAHLRIAQSYLAQGNNTAATQEYERISATVEYPTLHRNEAQECIKEIRRIQQGLPARDPLAYRAKIAAINPGREYFVATNGSDANPGTKARPFATLAQARKAIRAWKTIGLPAGGIAVTIKAGEYKVTETFRLTTADSGTEAAPIVYRAETKGAVVLYGGTRLSSFKPVTDSAILERLPLESRAKVLQCDLKEHGITDYGKLAMRGYGQQPSPPTLELYFNGKPMTLARWPNEGFVGIKKLLEPGEVAGKPSVLEYDSDRHERWVNADDGYLFGYFRWLWADASMKIGSIDPVARTLTTAEAYHFLGGMDTTQGIIYYAYNLLEEIDIPGEWYLDRTTGILYFWPPSDPAQATIEIGLLSVPMVTMDNVAHVRMEGIVFDLGRYNCMAIQDCNNCLIAACTVTRFAGSGILIHGGTRCGILGCDISILGRRATEVIGGDRVTLEPGMHFVENCQIHDFARIDRTYTPAIQLEGVGNRVAHNLMYDCPSSVMRIEGNDHLIEYNEIHSSVRESDDQGTIDIYANPTYRGVIYRYNNFHHNGKTGHEGAVHGQAGIRFDDAISGSLVYGNIFHRSANGNFGGIQINSGRDNVMDNNIFADCKQGVSGQWFPANTVWKWIVEGNVPENFYFNDLYFSRYPEMRHEHMMESPGLNFLWRNVFFRCGRVITRDKQHFDMLENGVYDNVDPGFADAVRGNFTLAPDAPLFDAIGFRPIPVDEIGLYDDAYRATWPVRTTPVTMSDWR